MTFRDLSGLLRRLWHTAMQRKRLLLCSSAARRLRTRSNILTACCLGPYLKRSVWCMPSARIRSQINPW